MHTQYTSPPTNRREIFLVVNNLQHTIRIANNKLTSRVNVKYTNASQQHRKGGREGERKEKTVQKSAFSWEEECFPYQ